MTEFVEEIRNLSKNSEMNVLTNFPNPSRLEQKFQTLAGLLLSPKLPRGRISIQISPLISVTIAIRLDNLLEIVQQRKKNTRGRITKDIMLT